MTAYKCDRCGKFYSQEDHENGILRMEENYSLRPLYVTTAPGRKAEPYDYTYDLCPNCTMALSNWVLQSKEEE